MPTWFKICRSCYIFLSAGKRWLLVPVILQWAAKSIVVSESQQRPPRQLPRKSRKLPRPRGLTLHPARGGVGALGASLCLRRFISTMSFICCGRLSPNKLSVIGVVAEQMRLNSELSAGLINSLNLMQRSTFVAPMNLMASESVRTSASKMALFILCHDSVHRLCNCHQTPL